MDRENLGKGEGRGEELRWGGVKYRSWSIILTYHVTLGKKDTSF